MGLHFPISDQDAITLDKKHKKSDMDETKTLLKRMASPGLDKSDLNIINNLNLNS